MTISLGTFTGLTETDAKARQVTKVYTAVIEVTETQPKTFEICFYDTEGIKEIS
ncbi:MAG: hypothetical protein ACRD4L_02430 [Pyrinomonadaceae bacterium]